MRGRREPADTGRIGATEDEAARRAARPGGTRLHSETCSKGRRNYWTSRFVPDLTRTVITTIVAAASAATTGGILLECVSGAARRVPAESAAFGGRHAGWNVSPIAIWDDPADDESMIAWARTTTAALDPLSSGGGYINYGSHDGPDRALAVYGRERLARLRAVKARYDPENRFRFNLNILPAA